MVFYSFCFYIFLLAIVFFRLPNVYFLPYVSSGLFTTHAIARIILIVLFFAGVFLVDKNSPLYKKDNRLQIILLFLFFISSSLSFFQAQDIRDFLSVYKDIIVGVMSFFVFSYFAKNHVHIMWALFITIPFSILYQLILLFGGKTFLFLQDVIYQPHFTLLNYNLQRGRIYLEVYDEAMIPFLILLLNRSKRREYIVTVLVILILSYLSLVSNFRTRILMLVLGLFSSLVILGKVSFKNMLYIFAGLLLLSAVVLFSLSTVVKFPFYERFLLLDQQGDIDTVLSRYEQVDNSLEMGFYTPFGVGWGNYYDSLSAGNGKSIYDPYIPVKAEDAAFQYIHNNFAMVIAESGYISFVFYALLIIAFLVKDKGILIGKENSKKAYVLSFWLLFFFGFFNPPIPGTYQILFWGIRGLLL